MNQERYNQQNNNQNRLNKKDRKKSDRSIIARIILFLLKWSLIFGILVIIAIAFIIMYFSLNLPNVEELLKQKTNVYQIIILDDKGAVIDSQNSANSSHYHTYQEFPESLIHAVISTEDKNFFKHNGIDIFGIARAFIINVKKGYIAQGGSTITQQLAKNLFLTPHKNIKRKIQEVILAIKIEKNYSKTQIMEMYLNQVYLGSGNYGVGNASRYYFDKNIYELNVAESAMLAGLLQAPSKYSPNKNPHLSYERTLHVINKMYNQKYLNYEEKVKAMEENTKIRNRKYTQKPIKYATDFIYDDVTKYIDESRKMHESILVHSTINQDMQKIASDSIIKVLSDKKNKQYLSGKEEVALIVINKKGEIKALMGGKDYGASVFNRSVNANRQVGSLFKLFVYIAAFENQYHPDDIIFDERITIYTPSGGWTPNNYNNRYYGDISLKKAFSESVNTVAVKLSEDIGREKVIEVAKRMGVKSKIDNFPALPLGITQSSLKDITNSYGYIFNDGKVFDSYVIKKLTSKSGKSIYQNQINNNDTQVIDEDTLKKINNLLVSVVEEGTGANAKFSKAKNIMAGKTGTSQNFRDAWFIGYTKDYIVGVWLGNDDDTPMQKVTGGIIPAMIWKEFMAEIYKGKKIQTIIDTSYLPRINELDNIINSLDSNDDKKDKPIDNMDDLINNLE